MKLTLLTIILFFKVYFLTAQYGEQQIISTDINGAKISIPYDVDDDGFMDIVSYSSSTILWFRNEDGLGDFGNPLILVVDGISALEAMCFYDLNSDGLLDIIYRTTNNKIAWLENLNGQGAFGTENILFQGSYCYSFSVSDIDGDGDNDVFANLYASGEANRLSWFENTDGLGNFSDEILIEEGEFYGDGGGSILLNFDLDNDGDDDLITSYESYNPSKIIWYENMDGQGTLSASQEIYQFDFNPFSDWSSISSLGYSDINGDGKIDIIISAFIQDGEFSVYKIAWLENIDGQGQFSGSQNIHNKNTYSMYFYDLDNDGDMDILNAKTNITWFKNLDGQGNFSDEILISDEVENLRDTKAADFNGDGFLDLVSASSGDDKVAWYAFEELGIEDLATNKLTLYPNPTNDFVQIQSSQQITQVDIYNVLGTKVKTITNQKQINVSGLVSGIYLLQIKGESNFSEIYKLIKK